MVYNNWDDKINTLLGDGTLRFFIYNNCSANIARRVAEDRNWAGITRTKDCKKVYEKFSDEINKYCTLVEASKIVGRDSNDPDDIVATQVNTALHRMVEELYADNKELFQESGDKIISELINFFYFDDLWVIHETEVHKYAGIDDYISKAYRGKDLLGAINNSEEPVIAEIDALRIYSAYESKFKKDIEVHGLFPDNAPTYSTPGELITLMANQAIKARQNEIFMNNKKHIIKNPDKFVGEAISAGKASGRTDREMGNS